MRTDAVALVALAGIVIAFGIFLAPGNFSPLPEIGPDGAGAARLGSKASEEAGVTVAVTPLDLSPRSEEWRFEVSLETHSVELDDDLVRATVLIGEGGIEHEPVAWEGSPPGGHHREGVLLFNPVEPSPRTIEIKIRGVGGIPERSFSWDLN